MALIDQANLAVDPTFQAQVRMAALNFAVTAIRAAKTANSRADEKVYALAAKVLADGCAADVARFAFGIASANGFVFTPGNPPTATDAAVKNAVTVAWPFFAGVTSSDLA
jgi:hypothetical protein